MSDGLSDLSPAEAAQVRSLDAVHAGLVVESQLWAARVEELSALAVRAELAGAQIRRTLALELAGSWHISQLTAERWIGESLRLVEALPVTLSMMRAGTLLPHQAKVLLHKTSACAPEVASAVEREVLPDGAGLCPSDLGRKVDRVRLRIEAELADAADAERKEAEKIAGRRTWTRPTEDGMAVAGALLTPEQAAGWALGMDVLERRERLADRAAGIVRTAEQRRADLFAALPAMVLAGIAQDDHWRRQGGVPTGGRLSSAPGEVELPLDVDGPVPPPWTFHPDQLAAQIVLNVHVPVSTVLDLSHEPGSLDRYGPVSAEHVRLLRPTCYRRVMADADTGRPIAVDDRTTPAADTPEGQRQQILDMLTPAVVTDTDEPQHDPSTRLARLVDLRDVRCCGPGCSSGRCDRDHLRRHPDGPTSADNLGLLSRRCHSAKHHGWTLLRHPDGSVTWHSPLRRSYDRPGPWDPPPHIDPFTELPPPRTRAVSQTTDDQHDVPLLDRLQPPDAPPAPAPAPVQPDPPTDTLHGWSDEPPF